MSVHRPTHHSFEVEIEIVGVSLYGGQDSNLDFEASLNSLYGLCCIQRGNAFHGKPRPTPLLALEVWTLAEDTQSYGYP
jgi:hypothetical protein